MVKRFVFPVAFALIACGGAQSGGETGSLQGTAVTGHPSADLIPRTVLFGNPDRAMPRLSPDGSHIAWLAAVDGVLNIWVAPVSDLSAAKAVTTEKTRPIPSYFWAYDNRHILYTQDKGGDEDYHLYKTDVTSGKTTDLTPLAKIRAQVLKVSHKHPDHIIVGINDRTPQLHDPHRLQISTGKLERIDKNPGFVDFLFNDDLEIVNATRMNPDGSSTLMVKHQAQATGGPFAGWADFLTIPVEDVATTEVIATNKGGDTLYMLDSRNRNTSALVALSMDEQEPTVLAEHPKADGSGIFMHPTEKTVIAASFTHARREWKILDQRFAPDFDAIKKLADGEPAVVSATLDLATWLVAFLDDDGPVRYYSYDRPSKKGTYLFSNRTALEGLQLAPMHPAVIESRDGLELVNYLSLPPAADPDGDGRPTQALPMVLLVHGGPWARDHWGYSALHQHLADRGYAVLSVNYRGSTGFGKNFLNAGNLEWAGKMHDDLLDSVSWAVEQGIADKDRVCIMGGSYGGYATLVGMTMTPDTFACGVDIVGPSSILTLLASIPEYWKPMQVVFKTRVGDWTTDEGKAELEKRSPLSYVDRIKRPLLIGQGANDPRVKQAESDQIVAAMQAKGIPVSYVLYPDEGHGFHREPNKLSFFAATEAFLSAHLGGKYQPVEEGELEGTTITVPAGVDGIPGFTEAMKGIGAAR